MSKIFSFDVVSVARSVDMALERFSKDVRLLWAKSGDDTGWMSLPQHLADSAVVAAWLWEDWVSASLRASLAKLLSLSEEEVKRLYVFLAAVHDGGKASADFQGQLSRDPERGYLVDQLRDADINVDYLERSLNSNVYPHGLLSGVILKRWLEEQHVGGFRTGALADIVDAHHGRPSDPKLVDEATRRLESDPAEWKSFQDELLAAFAEVTGVVQILETLKKKIQGTSAMLLSGLVVMADWIASNSDAFPFTSAGDQLSRLENALEVIDLTLPWQFRDLEVDPAEYFHRTFGWPSDFSVRPVQEAAVNIAKEKAAAGEPSIFIVEAPTGEGKTEAGLAIAEVMGQGTGAQGVFFAAPTMATSNGLFDRTAQWASSAAQQDSVTSMYLAHSKNRLLDSYERLRFHPIGEEVQGSVVASQWLSGRKKGILSNVVVGTVDQVLMLALQARHGMLRHVGLAGKVVIIDEVHAYDAYMSSYLKMTLSWLAHYGTSVVLMSATLPPRQRRELLEAYVGDLGDFSQDLDGVEEVTGYPLVTVGSAKGIEFRHVSPRTTDLEACVEMIDDDVDNLTKRLQQELLDGGVALVICNTVRRAQETYRRLSEEFPDAVQLFHAAFIASDRAAKEEQLRKELGPASKRGAGRPFLRIVVATQVAEQSLDIDADLLVTDIAPMDLLIQRVGRLHRHARAQGERPHNLESPRVLVRGVLGQVPVPRFESGTSAIYDEAVLLATYFYLPQRFRRPDDIEGLVRLTYSAVNDSQAFSGQLPEAWHSAWDEALRQSRERRNDSVARAEKFQIVLPRQAGRLDRLFNQLVKDSEETGLAQVRDAEPTVEVVVIDEDEYGYRPFGSNRDRVADLGQLSHRLALELAASTVRLPARMTRRDSDFKLVIESAERQAPSHWKDNYLLKGMVAVALDAAGCGELGNFAVTYSDECGLVVEKMT